MGSAVLVPVLALCGREGSSHLLRLSAVAPTAPQELAALREQDEDEPPLRELREVAPSESRRDADRLVPLVAEATVGGHSVLVFCSSRKQCESAAALIADLLPQVGGWAARVGGSDGAESASWRAGRTNLGRKPWACFHPSASPACPACPADGAAAGGAAGGAVGAAPGHCG